jgi:hypothetical protein
VAYLWTELPQRSEHFSINESLVQNFYKKLPKLKKKLFT